jgi:hypothetical protein
MEDDVLDGYAELDLAALDDAARQLRENRAGLVRPPPGARVRTKELEEALAAAVERLSQVGDCPEW